MIARWFGRYIADVARAGHANWRERDIESARREKQWKAGNWKQCENLKDRHRFDQNLTQKRETKTRGKLRELFDHY